MIDLSVWKNKQLKELIDIINDYSEDVYYKNKLLLCANPLQAIALASEILDTIAKSRRKFENLCSQVKKKILNLGRKYVDKVIDEGQYERLIMTEDFKGRSVLKIIIERHLFELMQESDPKAENLMIKIY